MPPRLPHPAETSARTPAFFLAVKMVSVIFLESSTTTEPNLETCCEKKVDLGNLRSSPDIDRWRAGSEEVGEVVEGWVGEDFDDFVVSEFVR